MAANGAAKADADLAVGLTRVEPALAAWRGRRRHREAIPEELWRLIVPLARFFSAIDATGLDRRAAILCAWDKAPRLRA